MPYCPCCSDLLLPHARAGQFYFYCPHCRQEMPVISSDQRSRPLASSTFTSEPRVTAKKYPQPHT